MHFFHVNFFPTCFLVILFAPSLPFIFDRLHLGQIINIDIIINIDF